MAENSATLLLNADMQPLSMLPIKTIPWQSAIKGLFKGAYSVIHEYADWEVHSPSCTMKVPSVVMLTQYVKPRLTAKWSPENLWLRDDYTCQYCMHEFKPSELTRDHVIPDCVGGETSWTNIVAACHPCNNKRGHNQRIQPNRQPYLPTYYELVEMRKKYSLVIPDEVWQFYIMWPEDKVIVRKRKNNFAN
jgi:5-methylcytosine-specific restriction endonuclease McrA